MRNIVDDSLLFAAYRYEVSHTHLFTARLLRWGIDCPSLAQPGRDSAKSAASARALCCSSAESVSSR